MPSRHKGRQRALQILFEWDMRKHPVSDSIEGFYQSLGREDDQPRVARDPFMESLVRGTVDRSQEIDELIQKHAEHWRLERMPTVDRNVLRLAVYEMLHTDTPAAVLIDEAIELARQFSGEESVHFVNGVLDAVHRDSEDALNRGSAPPPS
jgi:N utilization substance protein B